MATAEVCRKLDVSPANFYKWKAKFGGIDVYGLAGRPGAKFQIGAAMLCSYNGGSTHRFFE